MNDSENTLIAHLDALRRTLLRCVTVTALLYPVGYLASPYVINALVQWCFPESAGKLHYFAPMEVFWVQLKLALMLALAAYRKRLAVPCTACRYCMPCPVGVEIPRIFGLYNQYKITGNKWLFLNNYNAIPEDSGASACVNCGRCVKHCPQKIDIPAQLKKIAAEIA